MEHGEGQGLVKEVIQTKHQEFCHNFVTYRPIFIIIPICPKKYL